MNEWEMEEGMNGGEKEGGRVEGNGGKIVFRPEQHFALLRH